MFTRRSFERLEIATERSLTIRVIGLDVSRTFGEIAYLEHGLLRPDGRVVLQHAELERFAQSLRASDEVVLEA